MAHDIRLTADAEQDLIEIYNYLAEHRSLAEADRPLESLVDAAQSLADMPERGAHPPELLALGMREHRQLALRPYRMIYRIVRDAVFIMLIVDGRRDMQSLLARRLLGASR
jgi:toxin ParE1/3/4